MQVSPVPITDFADARVDAYRNLKDRELAAGGGLFLAEGEFLVRRLLASDFPVESVLLSDRRVEEFIPLLRPGVPVYVAADEVMRQVIGYKFHSGIIACGRRKPSPTLQEICPISPIGQMDRRTFVICPEISNAENMGALIRLSAGFGVDALIIGPRCHDPFYRMSVRVSMGTIFSLPIVRSDDILKDLAWLKTEAKVELVASVLSSSAEVLKQAVRGNRLGLLFGVEAQGLDREVIEACDRRVTIPMHHGTDSLNVAVSAGIFLYHFMP